MRRILAAPLRFPPGERHGPSHSAIGLLAAIVEIASKRSYREFVKTEIFAPLGMTHTGFNGETFGLPVSAFAVGYGTASIGLPNIPANWGPTSCSQVTAGQVRGPMT